MMELESKISRKSYENEDIFSYCNLDVTQNASNLVTKSHYWDGLFKFEDALPDNSEEYVEFAMKLPIFDFNTTEDFWDCLLKAEKDNSVNWGRIDNLDIEYSYGNMCQQAQGMNMSNGPLLPVCISTAYLSPIEKIKRHTKLNRYGTKHTLRRNYGRITKQRPKGSKNVVLFKRTFNYEGIEIPTEVEECEELQNIAKNETPSYFSEMHDRKLIRLFPNSSTVTEIRRKRYIRYDLEYHLRNQSRDTVYEKNKNFDLSKPYEPQYIRYLIDLESTPQLPFNLTRSGLCPYCPDLHFYEIKTSAYAQHLALQHGVFTDNFLTPNPLYYGLYKLVKPESPNKKRPKRTKAHELDREGIICPCCYNVIGVNCSKKTAKFKPLTNYLRHFRDVHFYCKNKEDPYTFFDKLEFKIKN